MADVRVGIMGCGFIGGTHAKALSAIDGVRITALYDTERAKAEALAGKLAGSPAAAGGRGAGPTVFGDYAEMLASGIDALFVCLPPFAHGDEVQQAAAAGVHVFMEKPIALTSRDAEAMASAAEKAGTITQVGYMMRYSEAIARIRELMVDGSAGRPTLYQATYACNALHAPWWRDRLKSGGQIFEQAIHLYDLALSFLGTPNSVSAMMGNLCHTDVEGYTIEDTSSVVIGFAGGAIANITATNCAVPGEWNHSFTLVCEKLVATLRNGTDLELVFTDGEVRHERHSFADDVFVAEDGAFIEHVRSRTPTATPLRIGAEGVRLVEAATRAARDGVMVTL